MNKNKIAWQSIEEPWDDSVLFAFEHKFLCSKG